MTLARRQLPLRHRPPGRLPTTASTHLLPQRSDHRQIWPRRCAPNLVIIGIPLFTVSPPDGSNEPAEPERHRRRTGYPDWLKNTTNRTGSALPGRRHFMTLAPPQAARSSQPRSKRPATCRSPGRGSHQRRCGAGHTDSQPILFAVMPAEPSYLFRRCAFNILSNQGPVPGYRYAIE